MKNLPHLIALHRVNGLGPKKLKMLLDIFADPEVIWKLKQGDFNALKIHEKVYQELEKTRKEIDPETYLEEIYKTGIRVKTVYDPDYPTLLKSIYDPPIVVYYLGQFPLMPTHIGIVGTRNITGYGKLVTERFATFLAESGLVIVSGLARGVDSVAHQSTVKVNGKTVAVLGGGLSKIFPAENTDLAREIVEIGGAVISEFPPDFPSLPGNFPSRNRIISGLSKAVLVTEAAQGSGSLITAKEALDQGREVFAIPGPITSNVSMGALELIKHGAHLLTSPEELLEILNIEVQSSKLKVQNENLDLSEMERKIIGLLENEARHLDEICRILNQSAPEVSANLIRMEIKGLVKNIGTGNYIKGF